MEEVRLSSTQFEGYHLAMSLYKVTDEANTGKVQEQLQKAVAEHKDSFCIINPEFVVTVLQVSLGVHKALHHLKNNKMRTESLNTEILYNLHPAHTITKCLDTMGLKSIKKGFLAVIISKEGQDAPLIPDLEHVERQDINDLSDYTDVVKMKELYDIPDEVMEFERGFSSEVYSTLALKNN
ncbi:unnamed protein product [Moneuplotes crassus]|uniref:EKC/KEOPS complex subunit cgi121 n=1 Tax=Euplotes crassus TaxID=5936 RepID=A0AAD1Y0D5_EUPCR|nr:unnamed protein product [Moneuplotes crassus]